MTTTQLVSIREHMSGSTCFHKEVSAGRYPTLRSLAELLERTVKRDLRVLRDQMGAPIIFDREHGFQSGKVTPDACNLAPYQTRREEVSSGFDIDI